MIKEKSYIDKIKITESGYIQVRRCDAVIKDGEVIAKTFHRHVLSPGDSVDGQDKQVAAVAKVVWTPAVVKAFKEMAKAAKKGIK